MALCSLLCSLCSLKVFREDLARFGNDQAAALSDAIAKGQTFDRNLVEEAQEAVVRARGQRVGNDGAGNGILARGTRAREILREALGDHSFPVDAQAHHIFGVELFDTQLGNKLQRWGIDLNGVDNGVWLPKYDYAGRLATLHRGRPTGEYTEEVIKRLGAAKTKDQALEILDELRDDLLHGRLTINGAE